MEIRETAGETLNHRNVLCMMLKFRELITETRINLNLKLLRHHGNMNNEALPLITESLIIIMSQSLYSLYEKPSFGSVLRKSASDTKFSQLLYLSTNVNYLYLT